MSCMQIKRWDWSGAMIRSKSFFFRLEARKRERERLIQLGFLCIVHTAAVLLILFCGNSIYTSPYGYKRLSV